MKNKNTGFVYILTNPSFREDWVKIGKSKRPVDTRSKELDNTAVPLPFEIFATMQTVKFNEVEKSVHEKILKDFRIRPTREFFNVTPEKVLNILKGLAEFIDDAVIREYTKDGQIQSVTDHEDRTPKLTTKQNPTKKTQKPPFKFSMVKIKPGTKIRFDPMGAEVVVVSDDSIKYKGQNYRLSPFVVKFLPKKQQNSSGAYQGPKYFSYKGKKLTDLRKSMKGKNS